MLNDASMQAVQEAVLPHGFVRPLYDSFCFSNLTATIQSLFGRNGSGRSTLPDSVLGGFQRRYKKVVVCFVDAFGWEFFERWQSSSSPLAELAERGVVSKLTSLFPSTTAACVTNIHTGMLPKESGVLHWFYYENRLDEVIAPLLFSVAGDSRRDTLAERGVDPAQFLPASPFYEDLTANGIRTYMFHPSDYAFSPYNDRVMRGTRMFPYSSIASGLETLAKAVAAEDEPAYFYLYYAGLDSVGHLNGPHSAEFRRVGLEFFDYFAQSLLQLMHRVDDAVLMVVSDHGQVSVAPEKTSYLDLMFPDLVSRLETTGSGKLKAPCGSVRDFALHVKEEYLEATVAELSEALDGIALTRRTSSLLDEGFFGPPPFADAFLQNVGNLTILALDGQGVFWSGGNRFVKRHYGEHGGLTAAEMEVPLIVLQSG